MSAPLRYRAHAKINLGLEVLGPRPDGYHEIRTVYQSIGLCDTLEFHPAAGGMALTCSDPTLSTGVDNLVLRAARALQEATGCGKGARIHLAKRIPMQAGLGGGSSDAAATLLGLCRLWRLAPAPELLRDLARALGSDVPFFLVGGTALGAGRGEEVYALPDAPPMHLLVLPGTAGTPTGEAYRLLDERLTGARTPHRIEALVQGIVEGTLSERQFFNRFEEVFKQQGDEGSSGRQAAPPHGAGRMLLAGSGSSWIGIFPDRSQAQEAYRDLSHRGISAVLTSTLTRKDYWELTVPRVGKETLP